MKHISVLKTEVVKTFSRLDDGYFVDATLGAAGHSIAILNQHKRDKRIKILGIDKDQSALELAEENIKAAGFSGRLVFVKDDFKNIEGILAQNNIEKITGGVIDLGVSSMQLDNKERGFSFSNPEAPLDMRMDQAQAKSARDIVNNYSEEELRDIIFEYGEEQFAKSIAKNICGARKNQPIETVGDLLSVLERSIPERIRTRGGKHFGTKTFQALRIEVNKELSGLENVIAILIDKLALGGRLAIISFHSLEDRIVKNTFRELSKECICPPLAPVCACGSKPQIKILTKKPIVPIEDEVSRNPRSRSAKLRIVEKIYEKDK